MIVQFKVQGCSFWVQGFQVEVLGLNGVVERGGKGKRKVNNKKKDENGGERKEKNDRKMKKNNGKERINANAKKMTMVEKGMTIM